MSERQPSDETKSSSGRGWRTADVVPVAAAVFLLVIGTLVEDLSREAFARALLVLVIVMAAATASFIAVLRGPVRKQTTDLVAAASTHMADVASAAEDHLADVRAAAFDALVWMALPPAESQSSTSASIKVVPSDHVVKLERRAVEVWVWAYDLGWDFMNLSIARAVKANLLERCRYRYLIPDDTDVHATLEGILCRLKDVVEIEDVLEVRERHEDVPFAPIGVTLYNPTYKRARQKGSESCAVVLPHFSKSQSHDIPLIMIQGPRVLEYEQKFDQIWGESKTVDVPSILESCS